MRPDSDIVNGWKDIAAVLSVSVGKARALAKRKERPLPVGRLGGSVSSTKTRLLKWHKREVWG